VRRTITVQPVVLVWLRLLTPGYVGVFPALHRQRLSTLAAGLAGVGRLLRSLMQRHEIIIRSHILEPRRLAVRRIPNLRSLAAGLLSLAQPEHAPSIEGAGLPA
jgi:hypothetical protein